MPTAAKMIGGFGIALATTAIMISVTVRVCRQHGWVSEPRPDRWHSGTPAFFGGIPIWLGFLAVSLWFLPSTDALVWKLVVLSALMFGLGLTDDVYHLQPRQKLVLQFGVASLALVWGMGCTVFDNVLLDSGLSLLWVVGITNSFNLLDNMDGLSSGVGLITCLFLAVFCLAGGNDVFCQLTLLLAGSLAGFLVFNFYPACIFMGDCGSLFLGCVMALLSLVSANQYQALPIHLCGLLLLFSVPLLDTVLVSLTRRLRGQPISEGGTDHSSHRLVRLGFHDSHAVLLLYTANAASGGVALLGCSLPATYAWWPMAVWALTLVGAGIQLFRHTEAAYRSHTALLPIAMREVDSAD